MPPRVAGEQLADDAGVDGADRRAAGREDVDRFVTAFATLLVEALLQRGLGHAVDRDPQPLLLQDLQIGAAERRRRGRVRRRRRGSDGRRGRDDASPIAAKPPARTGSSGPGTMAAGPRRPLNAGLKPRRHVVRTQRVATPGQIGRGQRAEAEADGEHRHHALARAGLPRARHGRNSTFVPGATSAATRNASQLVSRTQPCDSVWPIREGSGVPCRP